MKRKAKILVSILMSPVIIVLLTAVAIYLPPVQQWAVDLASKSASESTGMDVTVGRVHLAFPLDISLETVKVTKQDSLLPQKKDTVAYISRAVVGVRLLPLLSSKVCVNSMELLGCKVNTIDLIPQMRLKGSIERMGLDGVEPVAEIGMKGEIVELKRVFLDGAHLDIAMKDSVPEDTTVSNNKWRVLLKELRVTGSDVLYHTAGDTLRIGAQMHDVVVRDGNFDLGSGTYSVHSIKVNGTDVQCDNTTAPYSARHRLDLNHISIGNIHAAVDSLSLLPSYTKLKINRLALKEKSGLSLRDMNAMVEIDSTRMSVGGTLKTAFSVIALRLDMDSKAFTENIPSAHTSGKVRANIDASIGKQDIDILLNMTDMDEFSRLLPRHPLTIKGTVEGSTKEVFVPSLTISMPTVLTLNVNGKARGFMNQKKGQNFMAKAHADLHTQNVTSILNHFTSDIKIPALHAMMDIDVTGKSYDMMLKAIEGSGTLNAKANVNTAAMAYNANVSVNRLDISHFCKRLGVGVLTGSATVAGQGADLLKKSTWLKATANVDRLNYGHYNLNNLKTDMTLRNGRAYATLDAHNELMDGSIIIDALMNQQKLDATLITELAYIDLYKLHMVNNPLKVSVCTHVDAMSDYRDTHTLQGTFGDIAITDSARTYRPDDITVDVHTDKDTTTAKIYCGDFIFRMNAEGNYKKLMGVANRMMTVAKQQFAERTIDQEALRAYLPKASITLHSSKENPIYRFIKYYDLDYDEVDATINTSREEGINADFSMKGLSTSGYRLDSIAMKVRSSNTPYAIKYAGCVSNMEPNDYVFTVDFDGELLEHGISLNTIFHDKDGENGLEMGIEANMVEEGIRLHLTPDNPVIGYERFKLKKDNSILLGHNNRITADVDMVSSGGTGIMLYSTSNEENKDYMQDITLSITKLNIKRILSSVPYAPNASGEMDADLHFIQEESGNFSVSSNISTKNLVYENCPIGNLGTDLVYMPKGDDTHFIDGVMSLDDNEVGTIKGTYNFNTSDINADMAFEKFPMRIVNGFIPDRIIGLEGYAEGTLAIHGNTSRPDVNGELYLESASLISVPYGVKMRFDDDPVRIVDSKLLFENFQMYANNNQPMASYGELDFSDLDHMRLNLIMRAENFMLIDSKETGRSEAYGKAYVNFLASIKGELNRLQVRGKLDVLPTTDIFYILRDSPLSNDNRMKELVRFTDLHHSDSLEVQRPQVDGLNVNFNVNVMNGSHIKCWLNDARTNYLDIIGEGALQMKYINDDISLTGRYTISEGELKYSLPVIPLKTFSISNGSYIEFKGDMMNPVLDITAKETQKASVNINGTERTVRFDTGVVLSKTLKNMGLEFIIEAPEDNAVNDDINMKSKEERGKLAVTMLTTGMYLSDGNTSSFSMNSALNSFLQSEINSIAGSALKTLDISFGMDNSTEEDGTMHTNYSFKFAKRFWNNRLSISVGGKLSTGPDVSGQNKSFFDNVEVQYRLSDISNKYLNLFYNRSVYDFLEGYVGQYGGGFMWKKKVNSLKDIFRPNLQDTSLPSIPAIQNNGMTRKDTIK